jgi:diaminopimelate epimerase
LVQQTQQEEPLRIPGISHLISSPTEEHSQASKRGGELGIEVKDDGRVILEGSAVTVLQGQLKLQ